MTKICRQLRVEGLVIWQGGSSFEIAFDLDGVLSESTFDLLIELFVSFVDVVNVSIIVVLSPSTKFSPFQLPTQHKAGCQTINLQSDLSFSSLTILSIFSSGVFGA